MEERRGEEEGEWEKKRRGHGRGIGNRFSNRIQGIMGRSGYNGEIMSKSLNKTGIFLPVG